MRCRRPIPAGDVILGSRRPLYCAFRTDTHCSPLSGHPTPAVEYQGCIPASLQPSRRRSTYTRTLWAESTVFYTSLSPSIISGVRHGDTVQVGQCRRVSIAPRRSRSSFSTRKSRNAATATLKPCCTNSLSISSIMVVPWNLPGEDASLAYPAIFPTRGKVI